MHKLHYDVVKYLRHCTVFAGLALHSADCRYLWSRRFIKLMHSLRWCSNFRNPLDRVDNEIGDQWPIQRFSEPNQIVTKRMLESVGKTNWQKVIPTTCFWYRSWVTSWDQQMFNWGHAVDPLRPRVTSERIGYVGIVTHLVLGHRPSCCWESIRYSENTQLPTLITQDMRIAQCRIPDGGKTFGMNSWHANF